jgi:hypothetical protein
MCLLVASSCQPPASCQPERAKSLPTKIIFSGGGDSLNGDKNTAITDFTISPDGSKVAVGFKSRDSQKQLILWLGEWDLVTGKLVAKIRLDKPIPTTSWVGFASFFHSTMRYSPDGSKIIVRAANDIYGFKSSDLARVYWISPGTENSANPGPLSQDFSISADGKFVAVLVGESELPSKLGTVYIYDANRGKEMAHWPAPAQILNLCLSQDGSNVLLTVAHYPSDILILDSGSGRVVKSFISGFGHGAERGAENAFFLNEHHIIAGPGPWTNPNGSSSAAKVFDSATGGVTAELMFGKSGWPQDMWLSNTNSTIAVLKTTKAKHLSFAENGGPTNAQIVFFHSNETYAFCALGPLREKRDKPHTSGFVRLSPDLKVIGLFIDNNISLYSTSECTSGSGMD